MLLALTIMCGACKKDKKIAKSGSTGFISNAITVPNTAGKGDFTVKWDFSEWEISTDVNGFISGFTYLKGGSTAYSGSTKVSFNYTDNPASNERKQDIILTNKTNGEKNILTVTQSAPEPVEIALNTEVSYQNITGFGGMNTSWGPKLTVADVEKMYATTGLGYNMMRIMIYPKKGRLGN